MIGKVKRMQLMTDFKEGDVVLVSYPFGEGAGVRKRPALVISRNNFNQQTEELIVAQITSRISSPNREGDYQIIDWREASLIKPAIVRLRLATLPTAMVLRRLGSLTQEDFRGVSTAILKHISG
jgi:mRNA interferase MazF